MTGIYDTVQNPVPNSRLFVTPENEQDLYDRIEALSGKDKALAYQIAMMTFNLSHKLVQDRILNREVFI